MNTVLNQGIYFLWSNLSTLPFFMHFATNLYIGDWWIGRFSAPDPFIQHSFMTPWPPFSHWSTSTGRMILAPNISEALICQSPLLFPSAFWWSNYAQTVLTPVVISMTYICWFHLLAWTFSQYFLLLHKIKFLISKLLPLGLWAD